MAANGHPYPATPSHTGPCNAYSDDIFSLIWRDLATLRNRPDTQTGPTNAKFLVRIERRTSCPDSSRPNLPVTAQGVVVIILGVILLIVGFLLKIVILWTIGIIVLAVGLVFALLGAVGRGIGGRRHYW